MTNTSNTTNGVSTLKVPVYSGKKEDFQMWWFQFIAHATMHGYAELMVPNKHSNLPDALAEGQSDTEAQKKMMRGKHTVSRPSSSTSNGQQSGQHVIHKENCNT